MVVHPQSIIHSLIQLCDGATLAHLGYPDMRVPISYALHYPERVDVPVRPLDLVELGALTFEPVDVETFACLRLAREAALAGGTAPCTLNAANEVAVHAFLAGRLRFLDIAAVIEETLAAAARRTGALVRVAGGGRRARPGASPASWCDGAGRRLDPPPRRAGLLRSLTLGLPHCDACPTSSRSWGSSALIILHEAGHFTAAKAVGMRVERFSLFFGPMLVKFRRGETEYGIGPIPLGRLREDHRDEPARGTAARGRAARLLQPAGLEADRGDPGGSGGEHA